MAACSVMFDQGHPFIAMADNVGFCRKYEGHEPSNGGGLFDPLASFNRGPVNDADIDAAIGMLLEMQKGNSQLGNDFSPDEHSPLRQTNSQLLRSISVPTIIPHTIRHSVPADNFSFTVQSLLQERGERANSFGPSPTTINVTQPSQQEHRQGYAYGSPPHASMLIDKRHSVPNVNALGPQSPYQFGGR